MAPCILNYIIALKQQQYRVLPAFKRGEILPSSVDALYKWLPTLEKKNSLISWLLENKTVCCVIFSSLPKKHPKQTTLVLAVRGNCVLVMNYR